jgi:hypothetical protein
MFFKERSIWPFNKRRPNKSASEGVTEGESLTGNITDNAHKLDRRHPRAWIRTEESGILMTRADFE